MIVKIEINIMGFKLIDFELLWLLKLTVFSLFLKKFENIWIIVIVVFYKNNEIFATRSTQKTLILLSILTNIRLDLWLNCNKTSPHLYEI